MKTAGIIAEYNPFHNGHRYQIAQLRQRTGADYVIVAMSGNFVQRGTPAIMDKYARAGMALRGGADLVIELPVLWATASAETFARGGVTLLQQLGVVGYLAFGAELPEDGMAQLTEIADLLSAEPEGYRSALQQHLRDGLSFPSARCKALTACMPGNAGNIMDKPNNILAVEYLKALRRNPALHPMQPVLIPRIGDGYHDSTVHSGYASATAIRRLLVGREPLTERLHILSCLVPKESRSAIRDYPAHARFVCEDDISLALGHRLLTLGAGDYSGYTDCTMELARRICRLLPKYASFGQFCDLLKTRNMTHAHIRRALLHILLNIRDTDYPSEAGTSAPDGTAIKGTPPYARILGFRKTAGPLLGAIKENSDIPLITKFANASDLLPDAAWNVLQRDIFASDFYMQIIRTKGGTAAWNEYTHGPVILPQDGNK